MESKRVVGDMTLVITGCGGFIGSHLLDALLAYEGVRVIGWDPDSHRIRHHLDNPNLELRREPLMAESFSRFRDDIERADIIMNLAAICNPSRYNTEPLRTIYSNFIDGYRLVEYAADLSKPLIHFSTSEVYGRTVASYVTGESYSDPALFMLDANTSPMLLGPVAAQRWTYACAKQLMERLIFAFHTERGLPFAIIRPFNFFGPRMDYLPGIEGNGKPRVLACFVAALLKGDPLELVDGGHARRTITSIHDAIDACLAILEKPQKRLNQFYNIGNPANEVSMAELADRARQVYAEITGVDAYRKHPMREISAAEFYGEGYDDCDRRIMDIGREIELLDWRPRHSLDDVLHETLAHYHALCGDGAWRGASQQAECAST